jgi:NTP pyrophosphatase (non-canonical NTP hydrolase)
VDHKFDNKGNFLKDYTVQLFKVPHTDNLNGFARRCHEANKRWWHDLETGARLDRNKGELLMLIVSEIAEAMEGERKDIMDDHLPHRKMAEVELADALIRIFDYAGAYNYDLSGVFEEKMQYNAERKDHTKEARLAEGGKKF